LVINFFASKVSYLLIIRPIRVNKPNVAFIIYIIQGIALGLFADITFTLSSSSELKSIVEEGIRSDLGTGGSH
jgi:hypothetical protein